MQEGKAAMDNLINIDVDDIEKGIAFYEQGIGLKCSRRLFEGTVAELLGAAAPIYLLQSDGHTCPAPGSKQQRDYSRHWTPVHCDFVVDDIESAIGKAVTAGATLETGPETLAYGKLATLSDPFGHGFCFLQWLGRGYDEVE
jgi:predicted enzyme related to lactoylglutathione lyase